MPQITKDEILGYVRNNPTKGADMMALLGQGEQFLKIISTPVGRELIGLLESGITQAFNKIVNLDASDEDKIRWAIYRELMDKICKKTIKYYNLKDEVSKGAK